jgi:hypothetical protein
MAGSRRWRWSDPYLKMMYRMMINRIRPPIPIYMASLPYGVGR